MSLEFFAREGSACGIDANRDMNCITLERSRSWPEAAPAVAPAVELLPLRRQAACVIAVQETGQRNVLRVAREAASAAQNPACWQRALGWRIPADAWE